MADEEIKKDIPAPAEEKGFWDKAGDFGARVLDAIPDVAAAIHPAGQLLQAATNNSTYQARAAERQATLLRNKEFLANADNRRLDSQVKKAQNEEYLALAPVRAANRENAMLDASLYPAERTLGHQKKIAELQFALTAADAAYKKQEMANLTQIMGRELENNPEFSALGFEERDSLLASPRMRTLIEMKYYQQRLQAMAGGDKNAYGQLDRDLRRNGWTLEDGEDGIKYLNMGNLGKIAATRESIAQIDQEVGDAAREELRARALISNAGSLGDPAKRSIALRANRMLPFNRNDAAATVNMLKQEYANASPQEQGWHIFNQAISDFQTGGIPQSAKLAALEKCMPYLRMMGFAVEGIDPKKPDPTSAQIIDMRDPQNPRRLSFAEFGKLCADNDTLGRRLDNVEGRIHWAHLTPQEAVKQEAATAKMRLAEAKAAAKGKVSTVENGGGEGNGTNPVLNREQESGAIRLFGDDFLRLSPEKHSGLLKAQKSVLAVAKERKLANPGGTFKVDMKKDDLDAMCNSEQTIYEREGLDDLAKKGFFHRLRELREAEAELKEAIDQEANFSRLLKETTKKPASGWKGAFENLGRAQISTNYAGLSRGRNAAKEKQEDRKKTIARLRKMLGMEK